MAWWIGRHPKDDDVRYRAAVESAKACLGLVFLAVILTALSGLAIVMFALYKCRHLG